MNFTKALSGLVALFSIVLATSCVVGGGTPPTPVGQEAYVDVTNDTFDSVDVFVDGTFMTTIFSGETHTYDLGYAGSHRVQVYRTGDPLYVLNDVVDYFPAGVSTWDIYDNAPVVLVENKTSSSECVDAYVDSTAVQFAIGNTWNSNVAFDRTICPGETGFYLVDLGLHSVRLYGESSDHLYYDDTRTYFDATHVSFPIPN